MLLNYAHREIRFRDMSEYRYRWTGEVARRIGLLGEKGFGEIEAKPYGLTTYENLVLARVGVTAPFHAEHTARLYVTSQYATRTTHDFVPGAKNWTLHARALRLTAGAELEQTLLQIRLSNVLLAKYYFFAPRTQTLVEREEIPDTVVDGRQTRHAAGIGDSLRYRFTDWLLAKASYEYAIRLPNTDEMFGNGGLIRGNPDLKPERSHDFNVGPRLEHKATPIGDIVVDVNGFWRETSDQILLIATQNFAPYRNIADARTYGVEGSVWWQSPGQWLTLDGSFTRMESRNSSEDGRASGIQSTKWHYPISGPMSSA